MQRFKRWLPSKQEILDYRWLQPVRPYLDHDELWSMQRDSVAKAVAAGLFIGFTMPLAQLLVGAVAAVVLRANVAVCVGATLITNPITALPIFFSTYLFGAWVLDLPAMSWHLFKAEISNSASVWEGLHSLWHLVGIPLIAGSLLTAIISSVTGFVLVKLFWPTTEPHASSSTDGVQ
jgi:uncharacterized protein